MTHYHLAVTVLEKAEKLASQVLAESGLDQLQKAQLLQVLVAAKAKVEALLPKLEGDEAKEINERLEGLLDSIEVLTNEIDFGQVQNALEHLSEGVGEMIKNLEKPNSVVQE